MKKIASSLAVVILFLIIASSSANAQGKHGVVGKLFDKHKADVLFGKVIGSVQIKTDDLKKAVAKGKDYILFTIKNNRLVVTNEKKESLTDYSDELEKDEHMYFFSKSEVEKLLQTAAAPAPIIKGKKGGVSSVAAAASTVTAEWRAGTITLSTSAATLEMSADCPPICFD